jgi:hypothetical protein
MEFQNSYSCDLTKYELKIWDSHPVLICLQASKCPTLLKQLWSLLLSVANTLACTYTQLYYDIRTLQNHRLWICALCICTLLTCTLLTYTLLTCTLLICTILTCALLNCHYLPVHFLPVHYLRVHYLQICTLQILTLRIRQYKSVIFL